MKSYTRYLRLERNYSPNTLIAYQNDLGRLLSSCEQQEMNPLNVRLGDLQRSAGQLCGYDIGPASQAHVLSGMRLFYRFLVLDGYIEQDPTELLESPRLGEHLPEVLSTEEVNIMENSIDLSKPEGQRNKAIVEVLFSCGLRVSELVNLQFSNLCLDEGLIRITGKGNKGRLVSISPKVIRELSLWLLDHNLMKIKPGGQDCVFLNRRDAHLARTTILIMLKHQT